MNFLLIFAVDRLKHGAVDLRAAIGLRRKIAVDHGDPVPVFDLRTGRRTARGGRKNFALRQRRARAGELFVQARVDAAAERVELRLGGEAFPRQAHRSDGDGKGIFVRLLQAGDDVALPDRPARGGRQDKIGREGKLPERAAQRHAERTARGAFRFRRDRHAALARGDPFRQRAFRRQADEIAGAQLLRFRQREPVRTGGKGRAPDGAAHLAHSLPFRAQELEPVAFARAVRGADICEFIIFRTARDGADALADVALHVRREKARILPEGQAAGVTAAVEGALQIRKIARKARGAFPGKQVFVIGRRRADVRRRAHAALDFQGRNARPEQAEHVFPHAQIGGRERVRKILCAAVDAVALAAGLFAQAAVPGIAADERGEIALPRKAGAQRALHEDFRFDLPRDGGDVCQGRFPREDDARKAEALCQARAVHVAHARLGGKVQFHFGIGAFEELAQKYVLQNERVGTRVPRPARAGEKGRKLAVFDERVEGDVHLCAEHVRPRGVFMQVFQRKIDGAPARGKIAQAQVHRIRARPQRGGKRFRVARGGQKLTHGRDLVLPHCAQTRAMVLYHVLRRLKRILPRCAAKEEKLRPARPEKPSAAATDPGHAAPPTPANGCRRPTYTVDSFFQSCNKTRRFLFIFANTTS